MKIVYLLAFVLVYSNLLAQNPGNVGLANLTAWFKPDALSLGNVTSWTTSYPVGGITVTDGLNTISTGNKYTCWRDFEL